jgi:hypothetical protein
VYLRHTSENRYCLAHGSMRFKANQPINGVSLAFSTTVSSGVAGENTTRCSRGRWTEARNTFGLICDCMAHKFAVSHKHGNRQRRRHGTKYGTEHGTSSGRAYLVQGEPEDTPSSLYRGDVSPTDELIHLVDRHLGTLGSYRPVSGIHLCMHVKCVVNTA